MIQYIGESLWQNGYCLFTNFVSADDTTFLPSSRTTREWGWEIFQSIEKFCKLPFGYGSFHDVRKVNSTALDETESFFLGETLKYLYLLMDPDSEVDLETVCNTNIWS